MNSYNPFGLTPLITTRTTTLQVTTRTATLQDTDDIFYSDDDDGGDENIVPKRLPLFSRCPQTNTAIFQAPMPGQSDAPLSLSKRLPLLSISPNQCHGNVGNSAANRNTNPFSAARKLGSSNLGPVKPVSYSQVAQKVSVSDDTSQLLTTAAAAQQRTVKASLDDIKDTSVTALTNKQGKGKYWFKSGCPTPDPRWPAAQQLMIGPIPGDVEYAQLRTAFLAKGHTIHLFIQNNAAWLEKNQEKFGKKQVKFGYVVYTDAAVPVRLLKSGGVIVGKTKIRVKEMDGRPAQFTA